MPNVMVALSNIGGALCSTPQSSADAHYQGRIMVIALCHEHLHIAFFVFSLFVVFL